jgi:hypothetical protein
LATKKNSPKPKTRQASDIKAWRDSVEARLAALESEQLSRHPRDPMGRLVAFSDALALKKAKLALPKPPGEQPARSFEELQALGTLSEERAAAELGVRDRTIRNRVSSGTLTRTNRRIAVDDKFRKFFSEKRSPTS